MEFGNTASRTRQWYCDTGPIVASLDADEANHAWAVNRLEELRPPLLTCEAVLTEASYLVARAAARRSVVVDLVTRGMLAVVNVLEQEADAVGRLVRRYANVPMSLADACLVRIAERTANATVLTLDSDLARASATICGRELPSDILTDHTWVYG